MESDPNKFGLTVAAKRGLKLGMMSISTASSDSLAELVVSGVKVSQLGGAVRYHRSKRHLHRLF